MKSRKYKNEENIALIIAGWCMGMQTMPASAIVILTCSLIALSVFQKRNIAE